MISQYDMSYTNGKTFDTVDHTILVKTFHLYGIHENVLAWLSSYLNNISQLAHNNYDNSSIKYITRGVPQGFTFGPLLFIVYINYFSRGPVLLLSILFADDKSVFIKYINYDKYIN